jgi:hypothetical protein
LLTGFTTGEGFTVTVKVVAAPGQPLMVAVTFTVAVTTLIELLIAVKAGIFPVPTVPNPTSAVLVQL